jgi:hypothetical protein
MWFISRKSIMEMVQSSHPCMNQRLFEKKLFSKKFTLWNNANRLSKRSCKDILKLLIKVTESWATRLNLSFAKIGDQVKIAQLDKGKGWSL